MRRELWTILFLLVAVLGSALGGATDWQTLPAQDGSNRVFMYDTSGTFLTSGEFRAYVLGADSSDVDNQFDGVQDPTTLAYDFTTPRDVWVSIWRINGTNVLIEPKHKLFGGLLGSGSVDDTTLIDGKVTTSKLAALAVTSSKIDSAALLSWHYANGSIGFPALALATIRPENMASTASNKWFSAADGDTVEGQYGMFARLEPVPGGGYFEIVGPFYVYNANDVQSGADLTFLSGSSLLANSGSTVTLATNVTLGSGSSAIHLDGAPTMDRTATAEDSLLVFTTQAASDSQKVGLRVSGMVALEDLQLQTTYPASTASKEYKMPGVIPGRTICDASMCDGTASPLIYFDCSISTAGVVKLRPNSAFGPSCTVCIRVRNKW